MSKPMAIVPKLGLVRSHSQYLPRLKVIKAAAPLPQYLSILWVMSFAGIGALTRMGLQELFGENLAAILTPGTVLFQVLISNMAGSFAMGVVITMLRVKFKYPGLYLGFTTGYCGSLTSFSTWNQQMSLLLIENGHSSVDVGPVAAMLGMCVGFWLPVGSFIAGRNVTEVCGWSEPVEAVDSIPSPLIENLALKEPIQNDFEPANENNFDAKWIYERSRMDNLMCLCLLLMFALPAVGVAVSQGEWKGVFLAVIFAPFGAVSRYLIGKCIPKFHGWFPTGTFLVNMLGSALVAIWAILHRIYSDSEDWLWIGNVVYALSSGFTACLTTVSSFVAEAAELYEKPKTRKLFTRSHKYVLATIVMGQMVGLVVNATYYYTIQEE